ncbi:MAG: FISUMP domain-containing protein [Bacteroidota bacterium]
MKKYIFVCIYVILIVPLSVRGQLKLLSEPVSVSCSEHSSAIPSFGEGELIHFNDCNFTPVITGPSVVCEGSTNNIYQTEASGSSFNWSISAGGTITSGAGTNTITVTWSTSGSRWISVDFVNSSGCTALSPTVFYVTVSQQLPASVSITGSANPVCQGTIVTYTAVPVNGGSSPSYQWQVNGVNTGPNNAVFSNVPANSDQVRCFLTSSFGCATGSPAASNILYMAVSNNLPVSVSISANPGNQVCDGTQVTFTAVPVNGGTSPAYQWQVNGVNAGTNNFRYTYTPVNGDAVTCLLTSNTPCSSGNPATSNPISMVVNSNIPVGVTIASSGNPVCAGTPVTFTATPVNGGSFPVFMWIVNGVGVGANSPTYSYIPSNGDQVACFLLSSLLNCATNNPALSNPVNMTVDPILPVSVSVGVSANPVCIGTPVTFTAYPVYGGSAPSYRWYVNGIASGPNAQVFTYIPANGDIVHCVLTSSIPCPTSNPATSNTVVMEVYSNLPVSVSISASSNPVCEGNPVTFTAVPVNGGTLPIFQWYVNGAVVGGLGSTYSYIPANGDQVNCRLTSYLNCTSGNPAFSNIITISVNPDLPVSITITASDNPFCQGQVVFFTANAMNKGTSPVYQWQVNGTNAGTNSPTFSFSPANGDAITCILTSNAICASGNPATSNTLVMIINPTPPVPIAVTITALANPVCSGSPATLTAAPVNGGSAPSFQWQVNGVNTGTNNATFTFVPAGNDQVRCILTSHTGCTTGNPATSNTVIIGVTPNLPVSLSVSPSSNPVCEGQVVTYTAIPLNAGSTPSYQWQVNGVNAGGDSYLYSYNPVNGDQVQCIVNSSYACPTGNPATSNVISMTVNPNLPVFANVSASANPVCPGTPVTFTANVVNGGSLPSYHWQVNGVNAGTNSQVFIYVPVSGDQVRCIITSNLFCTSGNPATSNTIVMNLHPALPVSVTVTPSENPSCQGVPVTFTASPVNGGSMPSYQWKVNGGTQGANNTTFIYTPSNGDLVSCILTSNALCATGSPATSNTVTMTVNTNPPVIISVSPSSNPVCPGTTVTYTASTMNGGFGPAYQWMVNGINAGMNSPVFTNIPVNGDAVSCILTSSLSCSSGNPATSNTVHMTVSPVLPVSVTVSASANPVCEGVVVNFTATPLNGGSTPSYQWQVNGGSAGANNPLFSYVPVNGDEVNCILTSSYRCPAGSPATSNIILIAVSPNLPVSVSVTPSANPVCMGESVTFTAVPVNEGSTPSYQWQVNGGNAGINSPVFSYIPVNSDRVTCILTSEYACPTGNPATSVPVVMTVDPNLPVSVTILPSTNPVCAGAAVTFTASPVNGGSGPNFQWQVNGGTAGTNSPVFSYTPVNGDQVQCFLVSDYHCATGIPAASNIISMTVNPNLPVSVNVFPSTNPVCTGSLVTFNAVPVNGGSSPSYQWQINGINEGVNSPSFSYTPLNGDQVVCILSSNLSCAAGSPAMSTPVIMSVQPSLVVGVTILASFNPVCQGTTVVYTATPTNGGTSPSFQWQVNGVNAGTNSEVFSYIPVNGDQVRCILTSNYLCPAANPVTSNTIAMVVVNKLGVSVTINASANPVCQGSTVTFHALPVNGGFTPFYQWQVNGVNAGVSNEFFSYIPANNDQVTCILTSSEECTLGNPATSNAVVMIVNPSQPVSVSISSTATQVCSGASVTFTASQVNGGSSPVYQWQVNGIYAGTNSPVFTYSPANADAVSCIFTSNATCPTGSPATSNTITMTVSASYPVSISIGPSPTGAVCQGTTVSFTASSVNPGNSPSYQWKVNGVNSGTNNPVFSYIPVNGDQVWCVLSSNLTCATGSPATSNNILMAVNPYLPVSVSIVSSATTVCEGTAVNYTATPVNGGSLPAYQWQVNGSNTGINSPSFSYTPLNGDQVSCILTSNGSCVSTNPATSGTISMTVNPALPVSVNVSTTANPVCLGIPTTFTATPLNGGSTPAYQWMLNGMPDGINSPSFTYIPSNNDQVKCILTSNVLCATGSPATSSSIVVSVLPSLPVSVSITPSSNPVCNGFPVTFTAVPVNGGSAPSYLWVVNGMNAGTNSASFTYTPANGDLVKCILSSNYACPTGNPVTSGTITMMVGSNLPVSVAISASPATPVCEGTPVFYSAAGANGGASPSFQWQVNGVNAGANSSSYSYIPASGDQVNCIFTSNAVCTSGNPANSNTMSMIVNSVLPVSVSVNASSSQVCSGEQVAYTAVPVNGGSSPSFQWQVNGVNTGFNSPVFLHIPVLNDQVRCILTSSEVCNSGNPVVSNTIVVLVNPILQASVSITASANPSCPGAAVVFTAISVNGGSTPHYHWHVNGSNAGTDSPALIYVPAVGDQVNCILTSNASCITGSPATSNTIVMDVVPFLPVSVSITGSANPVCQGTLVTYTAFPVNGGGSPSYQWQVNGVNTGPDNAVLSYIPSNSDQVRCLLTSNYACPTGNPAVSNTLYMAVSNNLPVSLSVSANPGTVVCDGTQVTFTAIPVNGGSAPSFQWQVNGVTAGINSHRYTYTPVNGDVVTCVMVSNTPCSSGNPATSNPVTMVVNANSPVSVSIVVSGNPVCEGTAVNFTASPVNGGSSPVYQWIVNGAGAGINSPSFSYIPSNGDQVICYLLSSMLTCATNNPAMSNTISMTVNPILPVSVSIDVSANPICQGTVVNFTAYPVYGGSSPSYQWYVNGIASGTNTQVFAYAPTNNDVVNCVLSSSIPCPTGNPSTSNSVTMVVNAILPVSVSVTPSSNPVCSGTPVTFTAVPVNGGSLPIYQWYVNSAVAGGLGSTFTYIPVNGDQVSCRLTSYLNCTTGNPAFSNTVTMVINPDLPVSINIAASENTYCEGQLINFTANTVNQGSNPVYQWQVNGLNVGMNSATYSYVPLNGDAVTCILTSDAICASGNPATSNTLVMIINPNPPYPVSVTISALTNPVCAGTAASLTAVPVNGGTAPFFQWQVNGLNAGIDDPVFSFIPVNGDQVRCVVTSNLICANGNPASSNTINMVVNPPPLPASVTVAASVNPVCTTAPVTYTATPVNGGSSPSYQWQVNGVNAGADNPVLSYVPAHADQVVCVLTSSYACLTTNPVTSNTIGVVKILADASNNLCNSITTHDAAPFTLGLGLPMGGVWSGTGVTGNTFSPSLVPAAMNSVIITYTVTNVAGCSASASSTITLYPSNAGFVCGQNLTDVRDNQVYPTQLIGLQCWFSKNLNYGTVISSSSYQTDNCLAEKYCYSDNPSNCTLNGALYQWDELMQYQVIPGSQGLCPPAWHIPTEAEWLQLETMQGVQGIAGDFLKSGGPSGFNALLSGVLYSKTNWDFQNFAVLFWTSTPVSLNRVLSHGMNTNDKSVSDYNALRSNAFPVRCIKN